MPNPTLIDVSALGSGQGRFRTPIASPVEIVAMPEAEVLTLAEIRRHLKQEPWMGGDPAKPDEMGHPDDADMMAMVAAAAGEIDAPNGWLGRSIMPRTYRVRLASLEPVRLPFPPTLEVVSVSVSVADGGGWTFMDADQFRLVPEGFYARLEPEDGVRWPTGAAVITFRAGYEPPAAGEPLNGELELIKRWVRLRATDFYETGSTTIVGTSAVGAPFAEHLLASVRVRA